ncbi:MAG: hypothetical protein KA244_03160 [Deltaproteobacteria bacterium]|nr:hypothetical protein [Deltaproteobacteria bacterium]
MQVLFPSEARGSAALRLVAPARGRRRLLGCGAGVTGAGLPVLVAAALLACAFLLPTAAWAQASAMAAAPSAQPMLSLPKTANTPDPEFGHALAVRARWMTVPGWTIGPYLAAHTELNDGWSVGLEYLARRPGFDVVVSLDYSWLEARSGNFLGKNNNPVTENHFTRFDKLSSLSADVSLIGHWNLTPWMEMRFGAGLGIGYVFGDIYQITNNSGCTADNAGDPTKCFPKNVGPISEVNAGTVTKLESVRCSPDFVDGGRDTPSSPCYRKTDTYPFNVRVVPVLNVLLGMRFRLHRNVSMHLDGGFRLAGFYLGAGPEFRF